MGNSNINPLNLRDICPCGSFQKSNKEIKLEIEINNHNNSVYPQNTDYERMPNTENDNISQNNQNYLEVNYNNQGDKTSNSSVNDNLRRPKSQKEIKLLSQFVEESNNKYYKKQKSQFQTNNAKSNLKNILARMKVAYKDLPNERSRSIHKQSIIEIFSEDENDITENNDNNNNEETLIEQKSPGKKKDPIERINTPFSNKKLKFLRSILTREEMIIPEMDEATINSILNIVTYLKVQKNVTLFSFADTRENKFYIVEKGKMEYEIDGNIYPLLKYESIGTKALKTHSKLSCRLYTVNHCYVFCIPIEKYKSIIDDFVNKDKEEKKELLKQNYFFNFMDNRTLSNLAMKILKRKISERLNIIEEGSSVKSFFLIAEGYALVLKKGSIRTKLEENDLFGDLSLFGEAKSEYSYIVNSSTVLLEIQNSDYYEVLGESPIYTLTFNIFEKAIENSDYLNKYLVGERLEKVFSAFKINFPKEGEQISNFQTKKIFIPLSGFVYKKQKENEKRKKITKNDKYLLHDEKLYVNNFRSRVSVNRSKNLVIQYNQKNCGVKNGEIFLNSITSFIDDENTVNSEQCVVLEANWDNILKKISPLNNKKEILYDRVKVLRSIKMISKHLSELKLFLIADELKIQKFKDNTIIVKNGPISDFIYIVKSGNVKMCRSGTNIEFTEFKAGNFFGEFPIFEENEINNNNENNNKNKNLLSTEIKSSQYNCLNDSKNNIFNFIAKGSVECLVLDKNDYKDILESSNEVILNPLNNLLNHNKDKSFTLQNLYYIREIGCGTYGKVYLVHNKVKFYAMKTAFIQAMCNNKTLCQYYINEKKTMLKLNHPFIVKLYNTFKTTELIFFLMEFVEGITLRQYIDKRPKENPLRNKNEISFYGGILFIVLNYFQKMRIIHRDLKPENLMIEVSGYLKVIDFGVSKNLSGKDSTKTLIGTPHYMAPEIIGGKNYSFPADYWSVGVILYELFYGQLPFGATSKCSKKIFEEITEKKLVFPSDPKNKDINKLLKQLLHKNPNKRLCSLVQIKQDDTFKGINFDDIYEKKITPIYCPPKSLNDHDLLSKLVSFYNTIINNLNFGSLELSILSDKIDMDENDFLSEF